MKEIMRCDFKDNEKNKKAYNFFTAYIMKRPCDLHQVVASSLLTI